jgi:branched-chain amino acid transport system permease protein
MGQTLVDTLLQGAVLAPLAMGMTLTYGVSGFANVAQVEFATIGAYGTILVGAVVGGNLVVDTVLSIILTGGVAVGLYYIVFLRLLRRGSTSALIGSLALSIAIRALIQTITGPDPKVFNLPLERGINILGGNIAPTALRVSLLSLGAVVLSLAMLRFTPLGRRIRAVSTNPELAAAAGIDARRVVSVTWMIAGMLGAIAGVVLAVQTQVTLEMGFGLLLPVFGAVLLGGIGSVGPGPVVAAYLLAAVESLPLYVNLGSPLGANLLVPFDYRPAIGFVVLVAVLILRPQGLFGRAARRA